MEILKPNKNLANAVHPFHFLENEHGNIFYLIFIHDNYIIFITNIFVLCCIIVLQSENFLKQQIQMSNCQGMLEPMLNRQCLQKENLYGCWLLVMPLKRIAITKNPRSIAWKKVIFSALAVLAFSHSSSIPNVQNIFRQLSNDTSVLGPTLLHLKYSHS